MTQTTHPTVDVRSIPPHDRHPLIFSTFQRLPPGAAMELINDHDPVPLHKQFQAERHGQFTWQVLEQGPQTWRVRIAKAGQDCCGHCTCS